MERILRISLANIKKHKKQTALLGILIMFCMAITASAAASWFDVTNIFPTVADQIAVHKNVLYISDNYFDESFVDILREDERVTDIDHYSVLYSTTAKYLDKTGEERALEMVFTTFENHLRIERSPIETSLSDKEIAAMAHPVYLPYGARESLNSAFTEGDTFDVVQGSKVFSFTIAGFYECYSRCETNDGYQLIVTDSDYITLMNVIDKREALLYDCDPLNECDDVANIFEDRLTEYLGEDAGMKIIIGTYANNQFKSVVFSSAVLLIMVFMAVVVLIASAIMIRFRIAGDIQDQIQSIGVLEALGYTSKDISLAYTAEYLLTALAGIITGTAASFFLIPVIHRLGEKLSGHHTECHIAVLPVIITATVIFLFVGIIAYLRSGMVKKFPPVQAFRKGIAAHHFGKNPFPLKNTKNSVHLRLAMKGFVQSARQNIGLTVCIAISAAAAISGLILADMFGSDFKVAARMTGAELSDLNISVAGYADTEELAENIRSMPGVRKVLTGTFSMDFGSWKTLSAYDRSEEMYPVSYADFDECENIIPSSGALPVHDNEIAISQLFASQHGLKAGDNLTLEQNRIKKNCIISGIVASITNNGHNLYITHEGMKRFDPTFRPNSLDVYIEDGADKDTVKAQILGTYGKTITDTRKESVSGDTAEERIRSAAEQKMAELLANHNVDHVEYAVQIGDKLITGTSGGFLIRNVSNLSEIMRTQIGGIFSAIVGASWAFLGIAAIVVAVIIVNIMEQTIRRQRKELGIMLSMGYTSKQLMAQLAMRIMPAAVIAVILGVFGGLGIYSVVCGFMFGATPLNIPIIIIAAVMMILFCFVCGYLGAHRIKTISITELMTE